MINVEAKHMPFFEQNTFDEGALLFTFTHAHGQFPPVDLSVYVASDNLDNILIFDGSPLPIGQIRGVAFEESPGVAFEAKFMDNLRISSEMPVPRAVGGTVRELVTRGLINNFYSSKSILEPGREMFGYLARDPRLIVTPPSEETDGRFLLRARKAA